MLRDGETDEKKVSTYHGIFGRVKTWHEKPSGTCGPPFAAVPMEENTRSPAPELDEGFGRERRA